jgi:outer membrane biosynthesis protein TonB
VPEPAPPKVPDPPKPKKRPKHKIKISHERVGHVRPKHNPLSRAEIQKLLDAGAKAGNHTSVPGEDDRCKAVIKSTLYAVWEQPNAEDVGDAVAVLEIKLGRNGSVSGGRLSRKSGNAALDSSVLSIAGSVRHIRGLTPDFIRRHPSVTISFTVD